MTKQILTEHLGACWWRRQHDALTLRVLIDRLMDEGRTLEQAIDALLTECIAGIGQYCDYGCGYYGRLAGSLLAATKEAGLSYKYPTQT